MISRRLLPLTITIALFIAMAAFGAIRYDGFLSPQVFLNLLIDNAFLCVVAIGMTFVILTGGIDLSVGAVIALTTMIAASLLDAGWNPYAAMAFVLVFGALFGALQGFLIQRFNLAPFIVTLAGMFLARGCCYLISTESIPINDSTFAVIAQARIPVGFGASLTIGAVIALVVVAVAMRIAHSTEFGRTVYAIGGGESSARLMGLSVARTKIGVYLLSGLFAALGGIVMTFYMLSGYSLHAVGLELDAIAAVVIGGTLLAGGVGYIAGTLFGVLILGIIQTLLAFDGNLSSWWTKIVVGALLLLFCLLQRLFEGHTRKKT
ncbi:MAG: galactofuranose ABC transporter, permease protein YjfF [Pseudomonadota bacterium]